MGIPREWERRLHFLRFLPKLIFHPCLGQGRKKLGKKARALQTSAGPHTVSKNTFSTMLDLRDSTPLASQTQRTHPPLHLLKSLKPKRGAAVPIHFFRTFRCGTLSRDCPVTATLKDADAVPIHFYRTFCCGTPVPWLGTARRMCCPDPFLSYISLRDTVPCPPCVATG